MKVLAAQTIIDGNLQREVVVDIASDGRILSLAPLSSFPHEPANTRYIESLEIINGFAHLPS